MKLLWPTNVVYVTCKVVTKFHFICLFICFHLKFELSIIECSLLPFGLEEKTFLKWTLACKY